MAKISFEGIGETVATFAAESGVAAGTAVKLTGNGTVGSCAAGERFCGVALSAEGELAAVQVRGFVRMKIAGTVEAGWGKLSADGNGGVKADTTSGTEYLVVESDSAAGTVTILL